MINRSHTLVGRVRQIAPKYLRQIIIKTTRFGVCTAGKHSREAPGPHPAQARLRKLILDTVPSPHSKPNYGKALDDLFAFCASRPLSRSLLMEWRAGMESLSPSTINVRLSAVRKMVGEARKNGMFGAEEAANLTDVPNISQKGNPAGKLADPGAGQGAAGRPRPLDAKGQARLCDPAAAGRLRPQAERAGRARRRDHSATRGKVGAGRPSKARAGASARSPSPSGSSRASTPGGPRPDRGRPAAAVSLQKREDQSRHAERLGSLVDS